MKDRVEYHARDIQNPEPVPLLRTRATVPCGVRRTCARSIAPIAAAVPYPQQGRALTKRQRSLARREARVEGGSRSRRRGGDRPCAGQVRRTPQPRIVKRALACVQDCHSSVRTAHRLVAFRKTASGIAIARHDAKDTLAQSFAPEAVPASRKPQNFNAVFTTG